jgi:regulator of cell morphogenesis and NO signaling
MITTNMRVREIATQLPHATRLFETLKIDYCCGGDKQLDEACASAGVEVENVIET